MYAVKDGPMPRAEDYVAPAVDGLDGTIFCDRVSR